MCSWVTRLSNRKADRGWLCRTLILAPRSTTPTSNVPVGPIMAGGAVGSGIAAGVDIAISDATASCTSFVISSGERPESCIDDNVRSTRAATSSDEISGPDIDSIDICTASCICALISSVVGASAPGALSSAFAIASAISASVSTASGVGVASLPQARTTTTTAMIAARMRLLPFTTNGPLPS